MTSRHRRLEARRLAAADKNPPPIPLQGVPAPPAGEAPDILQTPLTALQWASLREQMTGSLLVEGTVRVNADALHALMLHAIIRERILADVALRMDNLHTVCSQPNKYADGMARRYAAEKTGFMAGAVGESVITELMNQDPRSLQQPV